MDHAPLSASPLRILDEGGALAVVLEHVPEDDALCAALVCTTFRDALFAQARHAVRKAGLKYAGKRLVSSVSVASSVSRLVWLRGLGAAAPVWVRAWNQGACLRLAAVIWRCCSGLGRTAASGTRGPAYLQQREVI